MYLTVTVEGYIQGSVHFYKDIGQEASTRGKENIAYEGC
jgi:hypothetical protein